MIGAVVRALTRMVDPPINPPCCPCCGPDHPHGEVCAYPACGKVHGHGPDPASWFGRGVWPKCSCGFDPHDNAALTQHWVEHGFRVVDEHGTLVKHPVVQP